MAQSKNIKVKKSKTKKYLIRIGIFLLLFGIASGITWQYRLPIYKKAKPYLPVYVIKYLQKKFVQKGENTVNVLPSHLQHQKSIAFQHATSSFGIDVSHYQGYINWKKVDSIPGSKPIDFVFIRSTMGKNGKDDYFTYNWRETKGNYIRGAYHYYRPDENSLLQADNFIKNVTLEKGDLPPVLDIEQLPKNQSKDSLKVGLKRWLTKIENHYKIRPILYSGDSYFTDFLEIEFSSYPLWIANYNRNVQTPKDHWTIWQYSEKGVLKGVGEYVDLNLFNGTKEELKKMTIQ